MKLSPLAASAAIASLAVGQAWAQGQISVSGTLDLGLRHVRNEGVGAQNAVVSGSNSTSRLIFSGSEDLGGGLKAGFHLEHGLLADVGTPAASSKFWDRRSTVSLSDTAWGELRLGRDFVPSYSSWSRFDPFAYVGVARSANLVSATPTGPIRSAFGSNANTTVRADNALQWLSPNGWGGLEAGLMLAAGEGGAVAAGQARVLGWRIGHAAPSYQVSAASTRSDNELTLRGSFKDDVLGASASVYGVKLSGAWRRLRYDEARQTLWMLGASHSVGAHEFKASWVQTRLDGQAIDDAQARQWGLGYVHHLSKRTALYAHLGRVDNDGAARFVISDGPAGMASGGTSQGYEAGLRHRF